MITLYRSHCQSAYSFNGIFGHFIHDIQKCANLCLSFQVVARIPSVRHIGSVETQRNSTSTGKHHVLHYYPESNKLKLDTLSFAFMSIIFSFRVRYYFVDSFNYILHKRMLHASVILHLPIVTNQIKK